MCVFIVVLFILLTYTFMFFPNMLFSELANVYLQIYTTAAVVVRPHTTSGAGYIELVPAYVTRRTI